MNTTTLDMKVHDFLAQKRIAVAGVSRANSHHPAANLIYHRLKNTGHDVFAVNPRWMFARTHMDLSVARLSVVSAEAIELVIDAAFLASLRREEGYTPRLSLAILAPEEAMQPLVFEEALPLTPGRVACCVIEVVAPGLLVVKHGPSEHSRKFVNVAVLEGDQIKMVGDSAPATIECSATFKHRTSRAVFAVTLAFLCARRLKHPSSRRLGDSPVRR